MAPQLCLHFSPQNLCECYLTGQRDLANMDLEIGRWLWIIWVGPISSQGSLQEKDEDMRDKVREHVNTESKSRVM